MDEPMEIIIRGAIASDKDFIMATWLQGNYYGSNYFKRIPPAIYFKEYANHITQVLCQPTAEIRVACNKDTPTWIVGFCVINENDLHWIYVKKDFRNEGIANLLIQGRDLKVVKSLTPVGQSIYKLKGLIFNPF